MLKIPSLVEEGTTLALICQHVRDVNEQSGSLFSNPAVTQTSNFQILVTQQFNGCVLHAMATGLLEQANVKSPDVKSPDEKSPNKKVLR